MRLRRQTRRTGVTIGLGLLAAGAALLTAVSGAQAQSSEQPKWNFVSVPDFFNFDIAEPEPKWDPAVDYFLDGIEREDPAFVLVAGDMVDGRWYDSADQVEHLGNVYYSGWMRRMRRHDLKPYTAIGDHELGDNPWPKKKVKLVPDFYDVFEQHMQHPQNGPEGYLERTYAVRHRNALIVTLQTFEVQDGKVVPTVGQTQLDWLKKTLKRHSDAQFVVVQGHVPILPEVKSYSSSAIMLKNRHRSKLWQVMAEHGVDLYFAGEHHAITCRQHEGVWQVVHGKLWGRGSEANYLLGEVRGDKLHLTLKQIPLTSQGGDIWNANKGRGPSEYLKILPKHRKRGFETVGTLTIDKTDGQTRFTEKTGAFTQSFEPLDQ
jgi:hypothetical protein